MSGRPTPADNAGMRFREQVVTTASPERAWELIADVSIHGLWNSHIVDTQVGVSGGAVVGMRYRITYELNGRRNEYDAEVVELEPSRRFVARLEERYKGDGANLSRYMIERYTLEPRGSGARVVHDVRVFNDGVPWYLRALVWLVMTTGRPVGRTIMQEFAALAEGAAAGAPAGRDAPIG